MAVRFAIHLKSAQEELNANDERYPSSNQGGFHDQTPDKEFHKKINSQSNCEQKEQRGKEI
jgi:hypothetical protein